VNSQEVPCPAGAYARPEHDWRRDDSGALKLDLRGRAVPAPVARRNWP